MWPEQLLFQGLGGVVELDLRGGRCQLVEGPTCLLREATCCPQAERRDRQAGRIDLPLWVVPGSGEAWPCDFGEVALVPAPRADGPGKVGAGLSYGVL